MIFIPIKINKINPSVDENYWLKRLDTNTNSFEPIDYNPLKVKRGYKTLTIVFC